MLAAAWENNAADAEWNAFLLFESLLLSHGGSAGTTSGELLEERLAWWWGGQWTALWDSAFGRAPAPPPQRPAGQADRHRAARVHTLAAAGEEGRALTAASSARPAPRTEDTLRKLKELFPKSSSPAGPRPQRDGPTEQLRSEVEEQVAQLLSRAPRLTSPGLLGTRLEHLALCVEDALALKLLCQAVAKVAFGELPPQALEALKTGEAVALSKDEPGEVRPLLVGATLRRLGLRALVRARRLQLEEAASKNQFGVGREAGAQLLYKTLQALSETRPEAAL